MSDAKFKARNLTTSGAWSLFADAGFDASPGDVIQVQLEDTPASDIWQTVFACILRSDGRSLPVFTPSTGIAATPTAAATFVMPAGERGTWSIQCQTNGGEPVLVNGAPDYTVNTKVRFFAARTSPLSLRHPLDDESTEYTPNGPSVALQELIDAVVAAVGAASGANVNGHYIEDTVTALNVNGIALRALAAVLGFKGTDVAPATWERASPQASASVALGEWFRSVSNASGFGATGTAFTWPMYLPDGAGTKTEAARFTVAWSTIVGPVATFGLDVATNPGGGGLLRAITFTGGGAIRLHGAAYAHAGYRLVLDGSGNVSASLITFAEVQTALAAASGSIAVNSQKITGLLAGTATGHAVEYDQLAAAIAAAVASYVPTSRTVTAGAGLTGGGALSSDITLDVAVNVDGGLIVTANEMQLGALGFARVQTALAGLASGRVASDGAGTISSSAISSGEVTTALGFTPVTNARTLTGTSPITIAGDNSAHDLSANRTIAFSVGSDVPWGSRKITSLADGVDPQDATAFHQVGDAINAAVNGTANKIQKATGTHTLGDSSITDTGSAVSTPSTLASGAQTVTGSMTANVDASGAADAAGLVLANTTSSGSTEQRPPFLKQSGYGHDSSGGGSQKPGYSMRKTTLTTASGNPTLEVSELYDINGSGGTFGQWVTSIPSFGGVGLYTTATIFLRSGTNGLRFEGNGNPGVKADGSGNLQVVGGTSSYVSQEVAAGVITQRKYGTKVFAIEVGNSGTTTDAATTVAITTYSATDESVYRVEATFTAWINNTSYGGFVRAATFERDGGTLAIVGSSITVGTDGASVALSTVTCALDASGTTIRGVVTGVAATTISWACVLKIVMFTP